MDILSVFDFILPPLYLMVIYLVSGFTKNRHIRTEPEYYYYRKAIFVKIFGAIAFTLIYLFYYGGGDTVNYFQTASAMNNLMVTDPQKFLEFYFSNHDPLTLSYFFNDETGYPIFKLSDHSAIFTSKCYMPFVFLGGGSFIVTAILAALLSFTGLWKLYQVFITEFPQVQRALFISIFAIPSLFFWGSGVMKDSLIISAMGWYVYAFYCFFIKGFRRPRYLLHLLIAIFLIFSIKAYIIFALLPGSVVWLSNQYSERFTNKYLRIFFTPMFLLIGFSLAYLLLYELNDYLGFYSIDNVAERAFEVNKDLKMDYYGGKSFDIGHYDPTFTGMISVAHRAIIAALYRPSFFDAQNIVMYLSALENAYFLGLTIFLLIKLRIVGFFRYIRVHPLILFSVLFSLFFAFSVGISISNFGSLVRLRIPALPFFISSLFIINYLASNKQKRKASTATMIRR